VTVGLPICCERLACRFAPVRPAASLTSDSLHPREPHQDLEHLETAYVVKCHRVALLAEPLPVFTFHHPNWATHIDNTRSIELEFEPSSPDTPSATMHGCARHPIQHTARALPSFLWLMAGRRKSSPAQRILAGAQRDEGRVRL
jgi:hypothetical protein